MARVLYDGLVEYEDGTPATTSQMAKDVVEFLNWSAEPEMDDRKKMGWKVMIITSALFGLSIWVKRHENQPSVWWCQLIRAGTNGLLSRQESLSTTLRKNRFSFLTFSDRSMSMLRFVECGYSVSMITLLALIFSSPLKCSRPIMLVCLIVVVWQRSPGDIAHSLFCSSSY